MQEMKLSELMVEWKTSIPASLFNS